MEFRWTPKFIEDISNLSENDKEIVRSEKDNIQNALRGDADLRRRHRIKKMQGHSDIWEGHVRGSNLVFTFHLEDNKDNGEKICFLRRVGTHNVYKNP